MLVQLSSYAQLARDQKLACGAFFCAIQTSGLFLGLCKRRTWGLRNHHQQQLRVYQPVEYCLPENLREADGKTDGELPMVSYNGETMAETMAEISGGCTGRRMLKKKTSLRPSPG